MVERIDYRAHHEMAMTTIIEQEAREGNVDELVSHQC